MVSGLSRNIRIFAVSAIFGVAIFGVGVKLGQQYLGSGIFGVGVKLGQRNIWGRGKIRTIFKDLFGAAHALELRWVFGSLPKPLSVIFLDANQVKFNRVPVQYALTGPILPTRATLTEVKLMT